MDYRRHLACALGPRLLWPQYQSKIPAHRELDSHAARHRRHSRGFELAWGGVEFWSDRGFESTAGMRTEFSNSTKNLPSGPISGRQMYKKLTSGMKIRGAMRRPRPRPARCPGDPSARCNFPSASCRPCFIVGRAVGCRPRRTRYGWGCGAFNKVERTPPGKFVLRSITGNPLTRDPSHGAEAESNLACDSGQEILTIMARQRRVEAVFHPFARLPFFENHFDFLSFLLLSMNSINRSRYKPNTKY